jgi:hypothetical protein
MVPNNKRVFERFFELKQQISSKKKEKQALQMENEVYIEREGLEKKIDMLKKMQIDMQKKYQMFYNISINDITTPEWSRMILFMGESAQIL